MGALGGLLHATARRSPSASTTSSPASRSTSSAWASPSTSPRPTSATSRTAARASSTGLDPLPYVTMPGLSDAADVAQRAALVRDLRRRGLLRRDDHRRSPSLTIIDRAHRGPDGVAALAHVVRAAAAVVRREPGRRGVAGRQRLPLQVHRRARLGRARRPRRRLPGPGLLQRLRDRPDRRPRLHRPRGDDLRQLAAGRYGRRVADVRLHRRACACGHRSAVHALLLLVAIVLLVVRRLPPLPRLRAPRPSSSGCSASASSPGSC